MMGRLVMPSAGCGAAFPPSPWAEAAAGVPVAVDAPARDGQVGLLAPDPDLDVLGRLGPRVLDVDVHHGALAHQPVEDLGARALGTEVPRLAADGHDAAVDGHQRILGHRGRDVVPAAGDVTRPDVLGAVDDAVGAALGLVDLGGAPLVPGVVEHDVAGAAGVVDQRVALDQIVAADVRPVRAGVLEGGGGVVVRQAVGGLARAGDLPALGDVARAVGPLPALVVGVPAGAAPDVGAAHAALGDGDDLVPGHGGDRRGGRARGQQHEQRDQPGGSHEAPPPWATVQRRTVTPCSVVCIW